MFFLLKMLQYLLVCFQTTAPSDFLEKLNSLVPVDSLSFEAFNMVDCFVLNTMAVVQMFTQNNLPKTTFSDDGIVALAIHLIIQSRATHCLLYLTDTFLIA